MATVSGRGAPDGGRRKRYNALGMLEDVPEPSADDGNGAGDEVERGRGRRAGRAADARSRCGAAGPDGRRRGASALAESSAQTAGAGGCGRDWTNVGRNDPCPCGSGRSSRSVTGA